MRQGLLINTQERKTVDFYNDPDCCIECIKDRIATADRLAIAQAKKNKEAIS
jgi:hypothetical protein